MHEELSGLGLRMAGLHFEIETGIWKCDVVAKGRLFEIHQRLRP